MTKYRIETQIEISASARQVWDALVCFEDYKDWNPFLPQASGTLLLGSKLDILIQPLGEKPQKYQVQIVAIEKEKSFAWLGHFIFPGLCDGHHEFVIENLDHDKCLLRHNETFRGLLVPFVWKSYLTLKLRPGFDRLNNAIKKYVEEKPSVSEELPSNNRLRRDD